MAGKSFIKLGQTGIGTQTTTERNAGVSTATGTVTYNVNESKLQVYSGDTNGWVAVNAAGLSATGGDATYTAPNGKNAHVFTSSGSLVVSEGTGDAEYIIVGGAGGGGVADGGGGGGAGGFRTNIPGIIPAPTTGASMPITPGTYPVTVGPGGAAGSPNVNPGAQGGDGTSSVFNSVTGGGGGGGGKSVPATPNAGRNGLSGNASGGGGGANGSSTGGNGGSGSGAPGNNGGASPGGTPWMGGGGGGAGGAASGTGNTDGGIGVAAPTAYAPPSYGTPGPTAGRWFGGGGGGGGGDANPEPQPSGGAGGGGRGEAFNSGISASPGTANTGGGGGGKDAHNSPSPTAGSGGSGIVIIFYD